jgi:dihydroorotase
MSGHEKLVCELTIFNGKVIWDLNGISVDAWDAKARSVDVRLAPHWTKFSLAPFTTSRERFTIYPPQP